MVTQEIKTRYETLKDQDDNFVEFVRAGFISPHFLSWRIAYEKYLKLRETEEKTKAALSVAVELDLSRRHVFSIIKFMES